MIELNKLPFESDFEYKLRLCKLKINKNIDIDWGEIVSLIGENMHPDSLRKAAYGMVEYDNYLYGQNGTALKVLHISDLHVPFQKPIETFSKYINRVDILVLNGDISDMQGISKFPKTYRVSPMEELIETRNYIIELISYIKPQKVMISYGNHDLRFQNYFQRNLDTDALELMPKTSLELIVEDGFTHHDKRWGSKVKYSPIKEVFENVDIEYIDNWYTKIGKTICCHPVTYKSATLKTATDAVAWFLKNGHDFSSLIMAHTHRVGYTKIGDIDVYESGCCCETSKLNYNEGKLIDPQKEGFIYFCQDTNGNIIKDKLEHNILN